MTGDPQRMTMNVIRPRRGGDAVAPIAVPLLAGCNTPPAFEVSEPAMGRIGRVRVSSTGIDLLR